ncbi:MAG: MFS transporter [Syntrophorhabdaceae bacterium]|nr:MFS transporter [Syntrophorhabdaceae bacterium]
MKAFGLSPYLSVFTTRRMAVMLFLGISSGLPLPLSSGTLQAWLTVSGLDLGMIGVFSLVGIPYTIKFLWSPVMDRFIPPFFGRRRGWILLTQFLLLITISSMGLISPQKTPFLIAVIAMMMAFLSASQDIAIDAYRTDVLESTERGVGVAIFIAGYRIGMLIGGGLALIMSEHMGWHNTYIFMALIMVIGIIGAFVGEEPDSGTVAPKSLKEAVYGPLVNFFLNKKAWLFILLIILYKLGDAYAGTLTTAFLLRGAGFSPTEVGTINKGMGLIATILGALFGGAIMVRLGLFRSLLFFGLLQMVSNFSFMVLAWAGKNYPIMIFAIAFENISGGMGSAAFVALIMALCNKKYSATQFALLSSIAALGRVFVSPSAGYVVNSVGWVIFFFLTAITALPGLLLLIKLKGEIEILKR